MFCAEGRQRDGEAQVGQGCDLVEATSLGDIVFRGQQANHEQRQDGGGHREGSAREFKKCGENSCLHGPPELIRRLKFYDRVSFKRTFRASREPVRGSKTHCRLRFWRYCQQILPWIISGCPSSESNPQFSAQVGTPTPTNTAARSCGLRARVAPIAISSFARVWSSAPVPACNSSNPALRQ